ncbi:hypothetical protein [Nonlabens antarcticus]|uniref:hypothetical protein n=1 Tax=Nonlabens antarcticus TaxID=392714 RepID=UPI0018916336|nr:hypothetical protein [Nonlabens antarcticus]
MEKQELIFIRFRESIKSASSFTQRVADCLSISYDAAYRRIQGLAKLNVDEAMKLAMEGQFSLDNIMVNSEQRTALGIATTRVNSMDTLKKYLQETISNLSILGKDGVQLFYSAKDIPIYHHFDESELSRFKIYVWMQLLDPNSDNKPFVDFHLPLDIKQQIKEISRLISHFHSVEIWNDTTISSSLKQIQYYHESGFLTQQTAIALCADLEHCLKTIESELKTDKLEIYYNELLIMTNNSMAIKHNRPVSGFVTMTMLGYIRFTATHMLQQQYQYFDHQMKQSMSMTHANMKDRKKFFQKMNQKINALRLNIERYELLDF